MSWTSEVSSRSPILWFKLDETSGTTFANSGSKGSSFNGTGHGGLTLNQGALASGLPGGSIVFNGSTGYISVPPGALSSLSAVTVLAWVKTSTTTAALQIVSADTGTSRLFQWRTGTGGTHQELIIPITVAAVDGTGTINDGTAHMLAFTYTSGTKKLYRDGVNEFSNADTGAISTPDNGFDIGAQPRGGPTSFWPGSIQEVAVFASALSAADITTLYNAGAVSSTSGTAAATLGSVTAAAVGTRTLFRTATAALGGVVASSTGVRTDRGTATSALGGVTATVAGVRTDPGAASAALGGVTAAATASAPEVDGTASAVLGSVTAAAAGTRLDSGTATSLLGALVASASGTRTDAGTASALLGALTAAATGASGGTGIALADIGALIAAAVGTVTGVIVAPVAGPFRWGFTMLAPSKALIPVEAGLDFIEWGFVMLQPGDALIGDPA